MEQSTFPNEVAANIASLLGVADSGTQVVIIDVREVKFNAKSDVAKRGSVTFKLWSGWKCAVGDDLHLALCNSCCGSTLIRAMQSMQK